MFQNCGIIACDLVMAFANELSVSTSYKRLLKRTVCESCSGPVTVVPVSMIRRLHLNLLTWQIKPLFPLASDDTRQGRSQFCC